MLFLFLIATILQSREASRLSTVNVTSLPVYSQASTASPVVKTLAQGDRVLVELEIVSGQAWCRIREPDQVKSSGYVLCAQLDRPDRGAQPGWTSNPAPPAAATGAAAAAKPAPPATAASPTGSFSPLDPDFWVGPSRFQRRSTPGDCGPDAEFGPGRLSRPGRWDVSRQGNP